MAAGDVRAASASRLREDVGLEGAAGLRAAEPPDATYEPSGTKTFAKAVAELLEQPSPDLVVSRMTKALRTGKVLVDWSQNDEHKTTVNVYSLRAKDRPTVSTPVTWDEVRACHEAGDPELLVFTADEVLARVDEHGDLFAPVLSLRAGAAEAVDAPSGRRRARAATAGPSGEAAAPAVSRERNVASPGAPSARTMRLGTSRCHASSVPR